jgi:hypothetical protein
MINNRELSKIEVRTRPCYTVAHNDDTNYRKMYALAHEGIVSINEASEQQIYQGGTLILPFLSEPKSSVFVARSWEKLVRDVTGVNFSIFPVSASSCLKTEGELQGAGFHSYSEKAVLQAIEWERLIDDGVIPVTSLDADGYPKGSKGRTLLAGTLLSLKQHPTRWVLFHDSDVINPEKYGALAAITGMLGGTENYDACLMALVGSERHNEQWTTVANVVALSSRYSYRAKKIAHQLARLVWPLSGERGFSAQWARKLPFALGMGIETIFNVACCEKEFDEKATYLQQIVGSVTKAENGVSDVQRENSLVTSCSLFLARLLEYLNQDNNPRPLWGLDLKGATMLNSDYSGTEVDIFVQPGEAGAQSVQRICRETVLPCIDVLNEYDYINWETIDSLFL